MKKLLIIILPLFLTVNQIIADTITLYSPDSSIYTVIYIKDNALQWKIFIDKTPFLTADQINLISNKFNLNQPSKQLIKIETLKHNNFNSVIISFKPNLAIEFRLYNNGFAYRWRSSVNDTILIFNEILSLKIPHNYTLYFPKERSLISHYERLYKVVKINELKDSDFASLPLLIKSEKYATLITDADLYDYPNTFLQKFDNHLIALYPKVILETKPAPIRKDRNEIIVKEADYIAKTYGNRTYPWRLFMLSRQDYKLLENNLVYELSRDNPYGMDFSWVKPGKVAWDWWNARNLEGVDFKPGINTETYKFYIDFAHKFGLEYVIFDEGWSKTTWDLLNFREGMDVKWLINYAKSKNVGIILWCLWKPLKLNMQQVLDSFAAWGVVGIKVDFMQRADQEMVNFYEKVAYEAAKRQLVVDFHGAFKPSGLRRAYPNVLSYEGVKGAEHNKWSKAITPTHNVTIAFIRNVVGPMDYTPGGMLNTTKEQFVISWRKPRVMGTRAHQVAMYVVYFSPLQMLADSPTNYLKDTTTTKFIAQIPTVWDQTIGLDGKVGQYIAVARRNGKTWYIGVMNGEQPRQIQLPLSFLPNGKFKLTYFADAPDANQNPTHYSIGSKIVDKNSTLKINLAWGGGYVAIIEPIK